MGEKKGNRFTNRIQAWHLTWYGIHQELGDRRQPKRSILRNAVYPNIDQIRIITGKYLSAIEDENRMLGLISEEEYSSEGKMDE